MSPFAKPLKTARVASTVTRAADRVPLPPYPGPLATAHRSLFGAPV